MVKWATYEDERLIEPPEVPGKPRAKKDRKKWCKGKVGREHSWGLWEYWGYGGYWTACHTVGKRCTKCGKHGPLKNTHRLLGNWHSFEDCPIRRNPLEDVAEMIQQAEASLRASKSI